MPLMQLFNFGPKGPRSGWMVRAPASARLMSSRSSCSRRSSSSLWATMAANSGASDYMVKPFNPDFLLERLPRLVKSSAMVWGKPLVATAPTSET